MNKVICPDCGRKLSKHLVAFPMFFDDNDETHIYFMCPLCALEGINKSLSLPVNTPFKREHSRKLYKEALKEIKISGQIYKKSPIDRKDIKWRTLVRLTSDEYSKVTKKHPELKRDN